MPGPSSPDGVAGRVSSAPSWWASSDMSATVAASPPSARASACAASLPELSSSPSSSSRTVYVPAGPDAGLAAVDRDVLGRAVHHRVRVQVAAHRPAR